MKISIFGLGYVGAVSMACLARDGHDVVGVDIDPVKLALIRSGRSPIIEDGIQELTQSVVAAGRVTVTDDIPAAIRDTEVSFVCVGTPSSPNGSQDLAAIARVMESIGAALAAKDAFHSVVLRSTVQPGTLDELVRPILERTSGKKSDSDFGLAFQPEFLREGTSIKDYDYPPMTVIGTQSAQAAEVVRGIFSHLPCDFIVTSIGVAEMLKYACNAFHALKITFANEIGRVSRTLGVDSRDVMELICRDRQLNISPAYMRPGFAFGGSCLPKDLRGLTYQARTRDANLPMLNSIMASNRAHIDFALDQVMASGAKRIALLGLSFKEGTDDLRESPLVTVAERLIGKGFQLRIYDPLVNTSKLLGANKRYIEEVIPHISSLLTTDCREALSDAQFAIVSTKRAEVLAALAGDGNENLDVLDLVGLPKDRIRCRKYQGICW